LLLSLFLRDDEFLSLFGADDSLLDQMVIGLVD
jgi:hypothetical protein